jgi:hypothetical protein
MTTMRNDEMDAGSVAPAPRDGATRGMILAPSQHFRSMSGRTRTSRLAPATASAMTLLLGVTLSLSACGAVQQAGAAAIVDGTVISDQDVQTLSADLAPVDPSQGKVSSSAVLRNLILGPYVLDEAKRTQKTVSAADTRKLIDKVVVNPSPKAIALVQINLSLQQLDQASTDAVANKVRKAKITVNPRYGTLDTTQIDIVPSSPNWLKPTAPTPEATASAP